MKLSIALTAALLVAGPAVAGHDEESVRHLLHATFDKPESRLVVEPVVVAGQHAVAGWSQGDMGGRALLRNKSGAWSLILCSGDGIKAAEALRQAGIPEGEAATLATRLAEAESKVPRERLALFAKFEGTLMMAADGSHPPMHAAQHAPMQAAPMQHAQMQHAPAASAHAMPTKVFKAGALTIEGAWLRATPRGARVAGGYMKIVNTGREADRLVSGTLDQAGRFEIHEMTMIDNVMRMRPLPNGIEIKPGESVELKPGGYHIMGMDLQGPFVEGQTVKGTLRFEKAGSVALEYAVRPIGSGQH